MSPGAGGICRIVYLLWLLLQVKIKVISAGEERAGFSQIDYLFFLCFFYIYFFFGGWVFFFMCVLVLLVTGICSAI